MRAVLPTDPGRGATPALGELAEPVAGPGEVLIDVHATALNRADLLQIRGRYPPPAGESDVPGLEAAGIVAAVGDGVEGWSSGDRVAALLAGGGQAERVAAPAGQLIRLPTSWSFEEGAGLAEAAITAWTNLVAEGRLAAGERVLVSGATSGVGTLVIEIAKALGAVVVAAGRDRQRLEVSRRLGADAVVLLEELPRALAGIGEADLIVDLVGGEHLPRLLASLAERGRLVLVGLMAGRSAAVDLGLVLRRRLEIRGSVLRPRSRSEKAALVAAFTAFAAPRLERRELLPRIDAVYPFERVAAAYAHLEHDRPLGKVVLRLV